MKIYVKHILACLAICILYACTVNAQSSKVDSAVMAIKSHPTPDSNRINSILYLPSISLDINYIETLKLLKEAAHIADSLKLIDKKGKAYYYMGKIFVSDRDRDEAIQSLQKAIEIFGKTHNDQWLASSHLMLGGHQTIFYQYENALQHFNTAYEILQRLNQPELMIDALNQAATVYKMQKEYGKALESYTKIAAIADGIASAKLKQSAQKSMGDLYQFLGEYDKAVSYFTAAVSSAAASADVRSQFYFSMPLIDAYILQDKHEDARQTVLKMLQIANRPQNQDRYALGLNVWTEFLVGNKEFDNALVWLDSLMRMTKRFTGKNYTIKGRLYKSYADVFKQTGKYTAALAYYDTAISYFRRGQVMILVPDIYKSQAEIYRKIPDNELLQLGKALNRNMQVKKNLIEAYMLYDSLSHKSESAQVKKQLAQEYANENQYARAYNLYISAAATLDSIGDNRESAGLIKKLLLMDEKKKDDSLRYSQKLSEEELAKQKLEYEKIQQELEIKDQTLLLMEKKRQLKDLAFVNAQTELQIEKLSQEKLLQSDNEKAQQLSILNKEKLLQTAQLQNLTKEQLNDKLRIRQLWLYSIIGFLLIAFISALTYHSMRLKAVRFKNQLAQEKIQQEQKEQELESKINEATQAALRSQMNPHFIFNVLNSINKYVLTNEATLASKYLIDFSKLMRLILENSNSQSVTLAKDLEALRLYMQMEKMRFVDKFDFSIVIDSSTDPNYIKIPPLLIQPYVENAIWHGIMQKQGDGGLVVIKIGQSKKNLLQINITDNGIGRKAAALLKSQMATYHKSFGLQLTQNRIDMANKLNNTQAKVEITDLEDSEGNGIGTSVTVEIPV